MIQYKAKRSRRPSAVSAVVLNAESEQSGDLTSSWAATRYRIHFATEYGNRNAKEISDSYYDKRDGTMRSMPQPARRWPPKPPGFGRCITDLRFWCCRTHGTPPARACSKRLAA